MAIDAAFDVCAFNTNILRVEASIAPPFSGPEYTYDRCRCRDRKMSRACVTADIDGRRLCKLVKTFQAWFGKDNAFRSGVRSNDTGEFILVRAGYDDRSKPKLIVESVSKFTEVCSPSTFCDPAAGRIQDRELSTIGLGDQLVSFCTMLLFR